MTPSILIPNLITAEIPTGQATVAIYDPTVPLPKSMLDADVLVVWGMSDENLVDAAKRLRKVKWVQVLSAGADAALAAGFAHEVVITNGRSLHDRPVAEHALTLVLAAARSLHTLARAQLGHRWAGELGGVQEEPSIGRFSTLRGARVLIWGFGSIGSTLAPHLTALGANVTGAARTARRERDYDVIATSDIAAVLPTTDVLIMTLPATAGTEKALSREMLAQLPSHAWVVNVGRGATIDEEALIDHLRSRSIGGAALDVTRIEPLPVESELWDLPNAIITPHAAGGRPLGAADLIIENLANFRAGNRLRNVVSDHEIGA